MGAHKKSARRPDLEQRVRTLVEAEARHEESEKEAARVLAMDRALGWGVLQMGTLQATLTSFAETLVRHLEAALARIWILNEHDNVLELQASAGLYTHLNGPHGRIPVGSLKIGKIAAERMPHLTNSVIGDPCVPDQEWAKREQLVAFAGYPLIIGDRLLGVVAIFARRPLSGIVLQAMSSVAARIAQVIDHKRAEAVLLRSEERFRAMIEHSSDAIALLDPDATIIYASSSTRRVLGYEPEGLVGTSAFALVHPEDVDAARRALSTVVERPHANVTIQVRLGHKERSWLWAECVASNCLENPHVTAIIVNYRDVTERRQAEERLREQQKLESLGLLAGGLAHDFNNLLTGIIGNASLCLDKLPDSAAGRNNLKYILAAAHEAARLTSQMLAYAGKSRFVVRHVDVSEVIRDLAPLLEASVPSNVRLQMNLMAELPAIEADPAQIQQLVTNLVINGAEAIGPAANGYVSVHTRKQDLGTDEIRGTDFAKEDLVLGAYVAIEVCDTGSGMDEATKAKIFDPFFTTKFQGRGLGLAAVSGIVRSLKGAIRVYTAPGQGSRFEVLLPEARISEPA